MTRDVQFFYFFPEILETRPTDLGWEIRLYLHFILEGPQLTFPKLQQVHTVWWVYHLQLCKQFWDPDISLLCSKIGCTIPEMWLLHENAARVSNSISHAHHQDAQCVASQWSGLKRRGALVKSQDPPRPMYQWPVLWMSSCIDVYKWHC